MLSSFTRKWALVADGFVVALDTAAHELGHPFGELLKGQRAVDVSGVQVEVGYAVDAKGNVVLLPPGVDRLAPGEPAYHDRAHRHAVPAEAESEIVEPTSALKKKQQQ